MKKKKRTRQMIAGPHYAPGLESVLTASHFFLAHPSFLDFSFRWWLFWGRGENTSCRALRRRTKLSPFSTRRIRPRVVSGEWAFENIECEVHHAQKRPHPPQFFSARSEIVIASQRSKIASEVASA